MSAVDAAAPVRAIREGLTRTIPVLLLGSAALVLRYLPIPHYIAFIESFAGGALADIFTLINSATFGMLSVYMAFSVAYAFAASKTQTPFGAALSAVASFVLLSGLFGAESHLGNLGVHGMASALLAALVSSWAYCRLSRVRRFSLHVFSEGADVVFNYAISMIMPLSLVVSGFALVNYAICRLFAVSSFHQLIINMLSGLFPSSGTTLGSGLLFVALSSLLWFFGVHGSDVLETVSQNLFVPGVQANAAAVAAGLEPAVIINRTFIDVFVLMGGCGSALCLVLCILLFGRQHNTRRLAMMAAAPVLFNINELMVFGLPIVLNATFVAPFLLTPVLCTLTSYAAMAWGLVPLCTQQVQWITPVLFGGWMSTGSMAGALLQALNIGLGVLIYRPFLAAYERRNERWTEAAMAEMRQLLEAEEQGGPAVVLTQHPGAAGSLAKRLAADLGYALDKEVELAMFYQPQYDADGHCLGAEALLRWAHPGCGNIYPPLIIRLAAEAGVLPALERRVLQLALADYPALAQAAGRPGFKLSVNATAAGIQDDSLVDYIISSARQAQLPPQSLCVEITEQDSIHWEQSVSERLERLRHSGILLAVDDFSMGHTSLTWLQNSSFDLVKLDGSLVRDMMTNRRSEEIILSILRLAGTLDFDVLGEYVENQAIRDKLLSLGCRYYQGYCFSPALPLPKLIARLQSERDA